MFTYNNPILGMYNMHRASDSSMSSMEYNISWD